jgi:two-component system torCAD operon response regulator TorR
LVDINLPGKDGLTLTREIRSRSDVGIILVTGKDEQIDRIVGLESGADDYVTKPFDPRELLSRVKNLLWRLRAQQKQKE